MIKNVVRQVGKIRYHGDGAAMLLGRAMTARKQIGQRDIYRRQHHNGMYDGYPYFVPAGVYKNTAPQQGWRNVFRQGMLAWNALPEHEKEMWRQRAKGRPVLGHNLFLKNYMEGLKQ